MSARIALPSLRPFRPVGAALLALLPAAVFTACGGGDDSTSSSTKSGQTAKSPSPDAHPLFGEPLFVDGERVSFDDIQRHIVLGSLGSQLLDYRKIDVFIQEELKRRQEAGDSVEGLEIDTAEIDEQYAELEAQVAEEYPDGEFEINELLGGSKGIFMDHLGQAQLFDKIFLPDNPYEYPPISVDAMAEAAQGQTVMIDNLKLGWDEQQKKKEAGEEVPEPDKASKSFFMKMQRSIVLEYLQNTAVVKYPEDGLPDGVAMSVNGVEVMVDEIWGKIEDQVTPQHVKDSKQWFVNLILARKALQASGDWLSDEEFDAIYAETHDPYKDSPFSLERVATSFRKFPSLSDYRTYVRIFESYKKSIEEELTDENLRTRENRLNLLISAKVDTDIILLSAYDFQKNEWKENGWEQAEELANEVSQKLYEGMGWDEALNTYSEFYDPPLSTSQKENPNNVPRTNKGRFVAMSRNDLLKYLEESDYRTYLYHASVGDDVFFRQKMGSIANPAKGVYGYYIPQLKKRTMASKSVSVENENQRELLVQDFVTERLNRWLWELERDADVRGLAL